MTPTPREAQARVDEARASLRAAERARDEAFAAWYGEALAASPRSHGLYAQLAREAGLAPERRQSVMDAVKRQRRLEKAREDRQLEEPFRHVDETYTITDIAGNAGQITVTPSTSEDEFAAWYRAGARISDAVREQVDAVLNGLYFTVRDVAREQRLGLKVERV